MNEWTMDDLDQSLSFQLISSISSLFVTILFDTKSIKNIFKFYILAQPIHETFECSCHFKRQLKLQYFSSVILVAAGKVQKVCDCLKETDRLKTNLKYILQCDIHI